MRLGAVWCRAVLFLLIFCAVGVAFVVADRVSVFGRNGDLVVRILGASWTDATAIVGMVAGSALLIDGYRRRS